jgi:hypothetical protein
MPERMAALARVWFASALVILALATALTSPAEAQRRRRDRDRDRQSESAGSLVIEGAPDGAEILIDEVAVGTAPLGAIPVEPGSHTVRVRMPGYTEHTDIVEVRAGRPTSIAVELLALSHVLSVTSEPPSAHVYVDGTFMGETPVEFDLLEGTHSVRISLRGYEEAIREVGSSAGTRDELRVELVALPPGTADAAADPNEWYEEPITWIAIGGGAVAIAVVIAVIAVTTSGSSMGGQVDAFCAQMGGCILVQPRW